MGFLTEYLSHIISFRRQTRVKYEDVLNTPNSILINLDNAEYRIFFTVDTLTCYLCKSTGHTSAHCKRTITLDNQTDNLTSYLETHLENAIISATLKNLHLKIANSGITKETI